MFGLVKDLLIFVFKIFAVAFIPFFLMCAVFFVYYYIKGCRLKKSHVKRDKPVYNKKGILHNLFCFYVLFPRQFVIDRFSLDPDSFNFFGLHMICGEQGSGKTMTLIWLLKKLKERFPLANIASNMDINFQDNKLISGDDLLKLTNGIYGQIIVLDEIQNWWSSLESKNIPPELLAEICQQRKQRKAIIGTSQVFERIAKPFREQTTILYKPLTVFGCLTIVRLYKPKIKDDGAVDKLRLIKLEMFVHDKELRESFDTYQKIERLANKGFKPRHEQIYSGVDFTEIKKQLASK